jgi:hypothetical protein
MRMLTADNKQGSSLLSFIIYLMLFSTIALFFCSTITSLILPTRALIHKHQSLIGLHLAIDIFVKDVRATKEAQFTFKQISQQELIWYNKKNAIGWRFANNRLERIEGEYNNGWKKKRRSIAAMGIKEAIFTIEKYKDQAIGVEIAVVPIIEGASPIKGYVAII